MTDYGIQIPTDRLVVPARNTLSEDEFNEFANRLIVARAEELRSAGQYPGMEVWYPDTTTESNFDAVVVDDDGTITTLPPYAEIEGA